MSNVSDWKKSRKETVKELRELADMIDDIKQSGHVAKIVGSSMGIAGTALGVGCLLAAPFTGGVSLVGAVSAGVIGAAGGATSFGAMIGENVHVKAKLGKINKVIESDRNITQKMIEANVVKGTVSAAGAVANGTKYAAALTRIVSGNARVVANAARVARVAGKASVVFGLILLPLNIKDLVTNSIDVHKKTPHDTAEAIRELAQDLEDEMNCI